MKLHVVVSANVILIWSQFRFPDPAAAEIHSEEQIKFLKSMAVKIENTLLIKFSKRLQKTRLPKSSNMKVWEVQAVSSNYFSLSNSLWSDGLTICFSLCLSKHRAHPQRH